MADKKAKAKGGKGGAKGRESVVTVERIHALVDLIVVPSGFMGNAAEVTAPALVELIDTLTHPSTKYAPHETPDLFAEYVAQRAFEKTDAVTDALKAWRGKCREVNSAHFD